MDTPATFINSSHSSSLKPDQDGLVTFSVVIPLKDEEANVPVLIEELEGVMHKLDEPWELICIDDGSTDGTAAILKTLQKSRPHLKVITFDRNYGQSSAFDAGFKAARGTYVITMDGDLQNDPKDIPALIAQSNYYDLVCGRRAKRNDRWTKRIISKVANAVRSRLCGDETQDTGCSLKLYRTDCLRKIKLYHGLHRFLPALFRIEGFTTTQVNVNHRERTRGVSKYGFFSRGFRTISDLFAVMWMRRRQLRYRLKGEPS